MIKHTVQAAVQQQATFAILGKTVENAGAANEVHGQTVDNLVKNQAALKGFSVTDVAGAFGKLESVTRDSAESFKLLSAAEDLARGTGKSLAVSALGVEKAFEGSATSLARYGIIIHPITTDVDRLKESWAKLRDEGVQFDAQQVASQALQLKAATLADKALTGQAAIAAIQARFGGEAATFANTAAGEYDRLKVSVDQLAVSIGTALLPTITAGITDLSRWADELTHSSTVSHDASVAGHDLSVAFHDIEDVAKTVGPPLEDVAKFVYEIVSAVGAPALLTAVGVFEGLKVATAGLAIAQGAYAAVLKAGAASQATDAASVTLDTTARTANTAALVRQAGSATAATATYKALAATMAADAAIQEGAFTAMTSAQATELATLVAGTEAEAAAMATATAAAVAQASAISALTASDSALVIRIQAATAANGELAASYVAAGEAAAAAAAAEDAAGGGFAAGLGALATGPAGLAIGIAALAGAIEILTPNETSWADANNTLTSSISGLNSALNAEKTAVGAVAQAAATNDLAASTQKLVDGLTKAFVVQEFTAQTSGNAAAATKEFTTEIGNQIIALGKSDPLLTHNLNLLAQLVASVGGINNLPPADIKLLINNQDPTAGLAVILSGLGQIESIFQTLGRSLSGLGSPGSGAAASTDSAKNSLSIQAVYAAQAAGDAVKDDVTGGKTHDTLTAAAKLAITQLQQGIALAQSQQQDLNAQMVDAVAQGAIAVEQSIASAQQNFITIGGQIATDIGTYIDQPLTDAGNALQLQADRIAAIQQGLVTSFAASGAQLTAETNALAVTQAAVTAKFAAQNQTLTNETNAIGLRAAALKLHQDAASTELPGGHLLSANPAEALRQLEALKKTASPAGKFAIQQEIDQYQTDAIAYQRAQFAVDEELSAKRAKETADIALRHAKQTVATEVPVGQAQVSADIALKQSRLKVLQDIANAEKTAATRSIDDWATEWLTKKITLEQFDRDIAGLIKRDVGSLGNIAKLPGGQLLEQQLLGQIAGLKLQATALAAGPQQEGAGFLPTITSPLTALQNEQKSIASIAHSDATNQATIATDTRSILTKIYSATKNTGGLSSLAKNPPTSAQLHSALKGVSIG